MKVMIEYLNVDLYVKMCSINDIFTFRFVFKIQTIILVVLNL